MWDRYIRSATAGLSGMPTLVVEYDAMLEDPFKASKALSLFLEQMGIRPEPGRMERLGRTPGPEVRHQGERRDEYEELVTSQRSLLASLAEHSGAHAAWTPPPLPSAGLGRRRPGLRRDYAGATRELHWVKASPRIALSGLSGGTRGAVRRRSGDPDAFEERSL